MQSMEGFKTPLPANLAAIATSAQKSETECMLAEQARQMSGMHTVAPVAEPTLVDLILVDHKQTLTLVSHFFKAAAAAESASEGRPAAVASSLTRAAAGAVAIDMLLHSKAEQAVVYTAVQRLLGPHSPEEVETPRAGLRRTLREHAELDAVATELLSNLHHGRDVVDPMTRLEGLLMAHQQEMETEVLPRLATHVTQEELTELAVQFRTAKQDMDLLAVLTSTMEA